jgi:hypothetical protein
MRKIVVYENGERMMQEAAISLGIHGGVIAYEIDLDGASPEEVETLRLNPYDDTLIESIRDRQNS